MDCQQSEDSNSNCILCALKLESSDALSPFSKNLGELNFHLQNEPLWGKLYLNG